MKVLTLIVPLVFITSCKTPGSGLSQTSGSGVLAACDLASKPCRAGLTGAACLKAEAENQVTLERLKAEAALRGAAGITEWAQLRKKTAAEAADAMQVDYSEEKIEAKNSEVFNNELAAANKEFMESLPTPETRTTYTDASVEASQEARLGGLALGGAEGLGEVAAGLAKRALAAKAIGDNVSAEKFAVEATATIAAAQTAAKASPALEANADTVVKAAESMVVSGGTAAGEKAVLQYKLGTQLGLAAIRASSAGRESASLERGVKSMAGNDAATANILKADGKAVATASRIIGDAVSGTTTTENLRSPVETALETSREASALAQTAKQKGAPLDLAPLIRKQAEATRSVEDSLSSEGKSFLQRSQREASLTEITRREAEAVRRVRSTRIAL